MKPLSCFEPAEFNKSEVVRIKLMEEIAKTVTQKHEKAFALKGGTALLLAYGLPRFSTDLDFDGKNDFVDLTSVLSESAEKRDIKVQGINLNKDSRVTKRYMMHYQGDENKPLK